jgi:hypothetical protein
MNNELEKMWHLAVLSYTLFRDTYIMGAICRKTGAYEVFNKNSILSLSRLRNVHRLVDIEGFERRYFQLKWLLENAACLET